MGIEGIALKNHCYIAIFGLQVVDHPVTDENLTFCDLLQPCDHPQGSGFATARWPNKNQKLLIGHLEVDPVHGHNCIISLGNIF